MRTEVKFNSVKEFVNYLIDNEGVILSDAYGREWTYKRYQFMFKDIHKKYFDDGLKCVHLCLECLQTNKLTSH